MKSLGGFAFAAFAATAWEARTCTEIGCFNHVVLSADIPANDGGIAVEVCRDGRDGDCMGADIDADQPCAELAAKGFDSACRVDGGISVRLELKPGWSREDTYALRVTDRSTGTVLVDATSEATYSVSYPNGRECDRNGCWRGEARLRPGP